MDNEKLEYKGKQIKRVGAISQVLLWGLFYFVFYHAFYGEFRIDPSTRVYLIYTGVFMFYIAVSVINIRIYIPWLFEKKKYKTYALVLFLSLALMAIIQNYFVLHTILPGKVYPKHDAVGFEGYYFFFGLLYVGLGSFFHFINHWHYLRENIIIQEREKTRAELDALKAQINPHLLFNTLNNIYSMSLDKSEKTPEIILKLSDLMSYVLYECNKEKVDIKSEIKFIENYVQLEMIRFEDNIDIDYNVNVRYNDVEIAPLIFLPFIENAFKHTGSVEREKPKISISIKLKTDHTIEFYSENTIFAAEEKVEKSPYSGIGIQNVTKRLEYLYPNQYELDIQNTNNKHLVNLKIEL